MLFVTKAQARFFFWEQLLILAIEQATQD